MHLFRYCSPARLFPPSTMPLVFLSSRLQTEGRKVESSPAKAEGVNRELRRRYGLSHQLLHACRVTFPEVLSGMGSALSGRTFTAPCPEEQEHLQGQIIEDVLVGIIDQEKGNPALLLEFLHEAYLMRMDVL